MDISQISSQGGWEEQELPAEGPHAKAAVCGVVPGGEHVPSWPLLLGVEGGWGRGREARGTAVSPSRGLMGQGLDLILHSVGLPGQIGVVERCPGGSVWGEGTDQAAGSGHWWSWCVYTHGTFCLLVQLWMDTWAAFTSWLV